MISWNILKSGTVGKNKFCQAYFSVIISKIKLTTGNRWAGFRFYFGFYFHFRLTLFV